MSNAGRERYRENGEDGVTILREGLGLHCVIAVFDEKLTFFTTLRERFSSGARGEANLRGQSLRAGRV